MSRIVGVNEAGSRIGEDHQNARYTDGEIRMVLALRAEGLSYAAIGRRVDIPKSSVRDYCKGYRRAQVAQHWKVVNSAVTCNTCKVV